MKIIKTKIAAIILTAVFSAGSFSGATVLVNNNSQITVQAAEKGITTGTDGKFFHADNCTREQAIPFLWRMAGKPNPKNMNSRFKDVTSKTRYSYKAVMWAQENGITTGTNGLFFPTGLCKRREIVTFIYRYKN